jgi:hypothetical protein
MKKDIFRTVRELLQSNKCVLMGNAVNNEGELYDDSVENLTALRDLEPHIRELVRLCVMVNAQWDALHKIIELIGEPS